MDLPKPEQTVPNAGQHDEVSEAQPSDTLRPDEAASPAELAFIERVRSDRARVRALRRKAIVTGSALIAASMVLVVAHGIPRWLRGDHVRATGTPLTPPAAPIGQGPPASDAAGTTSPSQGMAVHAPPPEGDVLAQRVARLEGRLGALERRATVVERPPERLATSPRATAAVSPSPAQRARVADLSPARPTARRHETAVQEATLGEKVRRGWKTVEHHVRRTPDEVRDGFKKLKRLFAD